MTSEYRSWPGAARTLALAVDAAASAATAADAASFVDALADLRTVDREQLLTLLGTVTQVLLERASPAGLDAEEAERILRGCLHAATAWYDAVDGGALLRAFTAGVGVADPVDDADDPGPQPAPQTVLAHGLLLVAYLCTSTGTSLSEVLEHALGELRRAQTMELP